MPSARRTRSSIAARAGRAVLVTCGDGTTSEGEWHESMNFAAVHKLPFVMLVENNESRYRRRSQMQMAQPEIWKRAAGYGMPGRRFNGFDPIETYEAVKEAMDRARCGGGPTLIEGMCYPFPRALHRRQRHDLPDPRRGRRARKDDPVPRFERLLVEAGIMNAADVAAMKKDVLRETNEATDKAEAMPYPRAVGPLHPSLRRSLAAVAVSRNDRHVS